MMSGGRAAQATNVVPQRNALRAMAETVTLPHEIADARTVSHVVLPNRTYDDFAALPEGTLAQLIDGDIIVSPAPNVKHQLVVSRLSTLFANFVDERRLGVVLGSPLDVRRHESHNITDRFLGQ